MNNEYIREFHDVFITLNEQNTHQMLFKYLFSGKSNSQQVIWKVQLNVKVQEWVRCGNTGEMCSFRRRLIVPHILMAVG